MVNECWMDSEHALRRWWSNTLEKNMCTMQMEHRCNLNQTEMQCKLNEMGFQWNRMRTCPLPTCMYTVGIELLQSSGFSTHSGVHRSCKDLWCYFLSKSCLLCEHYSGCLHIPIMLKIYTNIINTPLPRVACMVYEPYTGQNVKL